MRASVLLSLSILAACSDTKEDSGDPPAVGDRIVVAIEEESAVAVLDEADGALLGVVDLSRDGVGFDIHNVQGDPDGRHAWATAMPLADGGMSMEPEELVGIDVAEMVVSARIPLAPDLHVAHVVTDGALAWVTAKDTDEVYEVDLAGGAVVRILALPAGTGPHGLRRTPDGNTLIVAGMDAGTLLIVDLATGGVETYDVGGAAVQAAVLPDGSAAFVSVYHTRQVARFALGHHEVELFDLPAGAAGPVQLYPTPDSTGLWVADQGYLDGDPAGDKLYRLDATTGAVTLTASVSPAPHGVVVDPDGSTVWATTLVDGTVDRVDAATGAVLATTVVGEGPNGITCLHPGGATP